MRNIEKYCLQSLKRQNKLLANTICVKKLVCISKTKCLQRRINEKKKRFADENFSYPPSRKIMVRL